MSSGQPIPEDPRNRFAGERTLLAWIRTGLAMMGFGFVVARFGFFLREIAAMGKIPVSHHSGFSLWIGIVLVLVGTAVSLLAGWEHARFIRRLNQNLPYEPPRWPLGLIVVMFMGVIGLLMAAYLLTLGTANPQPSETERSTTAIRIRDPRQSQEQEYLMRIRFAPSIVGDAGRQVSIAQELLS
ncbi:YidH family protein [Schlesneria paludicola]|uniref:YidH family protein n=1 Tax=Schlesneria paludicola TaxID=360056 RepID=UPI00029A4E1B|nr:DUF202 domain-containing protein [Schlesneria paludicola]